MDLALSPWLVWFLAGTSVTPLVNLLQTSINELEASFRDTMT